MKKILVILSTVVLINSCSKVDDYLLGKDNTPKPTALDAITPKMNLATNWTAPVSKPRKDNAYLKLKPVIIGQVIYTASSSGQVEAVNKADGSIVWSTSVKQGIVSGPAVSDNHIVVGTDSSSLVLLSRKDGKELWTKKLSSEVLGKPLLTSDKVISKTIDGNLYALSRSSGEKLWVVNHGAPNLVLKTGSSPVLAGDTVLAGYSDGKLDAVDVKTGRVIWQRSIAYARGSSDVERLIDIDADPIVKGHIVFLATYQGYIGALSLENGQFLWSKPASVYKNMVMGANTLYITDSHDIIWAINATNGQVRWKQTALKARGLTEPALMGNRLVIGDKTGILHVLSTSTGEFLARTQLSAAVNTSPVTDNNHVFVETANGLLNQLSVS